MFGEVREQNIYATRRSRNLNAGGPFLSLLPQGRPEGTSERIDPLWRTTTITSRVVCRYFSFFLHPLSLSSFPFPRILLAHLAFKQTNQKKDGRMSTKRKIGEKKKRTVDFEEIFIRFIRVLFFFFSFLDRRKPRTMTRETGRRSIDTVGRMDSWIPRVEWVALILGLPPTRIGERSNSNGRDRGRGD